MYKIKKKHVDTVKDLIQQAMRYHQLGNLQSAEVLYIKILKDQPGNFDVLHMLGVLYAQLKNREFAVQSIEKALKINGLPDSPLQSSKKEHIQR